jgi:hypothetical protein
MPVVEKNDVNISKLFDWSREIPITGKDGKEIKIYLRLLGDADINRAKIMALRRSAELRKKLRDPESDEKLAFIPFKEELDDVTMIDGIIMLSARETTQRTVREVVLPRPKEPGSNASTEKLEQFQKEVDEYPKKREEAIRAKMEELLAEKRNALSEKNEEELYKIYVSSLVNELCEQELTDRFREYCIFFGAYSDSKFRGRFFESFETFDNLPKEIKDKLINEYALLEVHPEELKK